MNYYSHHIGDFNNATRHLTRVERSLYRDAIELYYDTESALTKDFEKLSRRLLANTAEEKAALRDILNEFFTETDDGFTHDRCDKEIAKYRANTSNKAKAGIASAEARKQKRTDVQHVLNERSTDEQLTNNHKPITNNQLYTPPIGESLLKDFLQVRKAKKAGALTETAFNAIAKEAGKANMTTEQAIEMCCLRGWAGFKASWAMDNAEQPKAKSWRDKIEYEH
jgi:uncharacterized protein YdaU (DUF1376 family)